MKKIEFFENRNVVFERIRHYRSLRGLSQEQLVARLQTMNVNIDQQALSRIERNQRMVTDYELACFCRALSVTEQELLADFYEKYPE